MRCTIYSFVMSQNKLIVQHANDMTGDDVWGSENV